MSKRYRNKFERSERDFYVTPIQSVAPSVSHLQAAGRRMPRDAAGRFSSARRKVDGRGKSSIGSRILTAG